jgi:hypothetical protein
VRKLLPTKPRGNAPESIKQRLIHTSYVFSLVGSLQVDPKGVKPAKKDKSKEGLSDKKSSKNDTKKKGAEDKEEGERLLTKEKKELEPKPPGKTTHISVTTRDFSGLLLDDDTDDEDTEFFDDDQ